MYYEGMIIPFEMVNFCEMNKKQAQHFFEWFMETKEERFKKLHEYIIKDTDKVKLDKTPESLIDLWEWFQTKIYWEEKTNKEIKEELQGVPNWIESIIDNSKMKISRQTLRIAYDIGNYFGEVMVENNDSLYWGFRTKPKKLDGVNHPIVLGFLGDTSMHMYNIMEVLIRKDTREPKRERLYDLYNTWLKMVNK
ncbi:MAG: hypothetical protein IJD58_02170 [Lachnospiraceae bacterium]|nr:hypothetical protein [Lachnospiraceae bacterium]